MLLSQKLVPCWYRIRELANRLLHVTTLPPRGYVEGRYEHSRPRRRSNRAGRLADDGRLDYRRSPQSRILYDPCVRRLRAYYGGYWDRIGPAIQGCSPPRTPTMAHAVAAVTIASRFSGGAASRYCRTNPVPIPAVISAETTNAGIV